MAFNKLGNITIAAGKSLRLGYRFGGDDASGGDDHGAQFCMADPDAAPGTLWVTGQGKERSSIPLHGRGTSGFIYHVDVNYEASAGRTMIFTLQGGGLA